MAPAVAEVCAERRERAGEVEDDEEDTAEPRGGGGREQVRRHLWHSEVGRSGRWSVGLSVPPGRSVGRAVSRAGGVVPRWRSAEQFR